MIQVTTMSMLLSDIVKQTVDLCAKNGYGNKEFILAFQLYTRSPASMTHRELEVIVGLASGKSNKDLATEMNLSTKTIEAHRYNLCKKLELHSFAELLKFAVSHKLIEIQMER